MIKKRRRTLRCFSFLAQLTICILLLGAQSGCKREPLVLSGTFLVIVLTVEHIGIPGAEVYEAGKRLGVTDQFGTFEGIYTGKEGQTLQFKIKYQTHSILATTKIKAKSSHDKKGKTLRVGVVLPRNSKNLKTNKYQALFNTSKVTLSTPPGPGGPRKTGPFWITIRCNVPGVSVFLGKEQLAYLYGLGRFIYPYSANMGSQHLHFSFRLSKHQGQSYTSQRIDKRLFLDKTNRDLEIKAHFTKKKSQTPTPLPK